MITETAAICFRYRVMGLGAEAAFFGVLSLPPLIFGLAGAVGFVTSTLDIRTIAGFREQLLELSGRVLTPDVVETVIQPTIDDVLSRGQAAVISIGFIIALWSGSRALNVFVDTITIMYGMAGKRGIVRTRALSFALYVVFLVAGIVLLPLILAGPTLGEPGATAGSGDHRGPLLARRAARLSLHAGDALSLVGSGSYALAGRSAGCRSHDGYVAGRQRAAALGARPSPIGSTTIYGPLAAPIAFLIWLYVISVAVLIGAAFNSSLDEVFPKLSGIHHNAPDTVEDTPTAKNAQSSTLAGIRALRRGKSQ